MYGEVVEPDIERGETPPWWSLAYSVTYPVELTGVRRAGPGIVEAGLADWSNVSIWIWQSGLPRTYVFANDLLQRGSQIFPVEYLDILLDIPRFRSGKCHDDLEKLLAIRFALGHCQWPEAF